MAQPQAKTTVDMPAGDARNEQLRVNADALAAEAAAKAGVGAIDASAFEEDPAVLYELLRDNVNQLDVTNAQPGYVYCWPRGWNEAGGAWDTQVNEKRMHRIRDKATGNVQPVWEFVNRDEDPEARGCIVRDTPYGGYARRIGDCVLMRTRRDWYELLLAAQQRDRDEREGRTIDTLVARAQHEGGIAVTDLSATNPTDFARGRRQGRRPLDVATATRALKDGTVAGLPPVGR